MEISPKQGVEALITTLALAEDNERWDLYASTLLYLEEGGARLTRLGHGEYLVETLTA